MNYLIGIEIGEVRGGVDALDYSASSLKGDLSDKIAGVGEVSAFGKAVCVSSPDRHDRIDVLGGKFSFYCIVDTFRLQE